MRKGMTKNRFLLYFAGVVAILAIIRWSGLIPQNQEDSLADSGQHHDCNATLSKGESGSPKKRHHPIHGVSNYQRCFPDSQAVQIVSACRWGVKPVKNRADAEHRKQELVYVGESPYYHVDRLSSSIPYLVPRAAVLLHEIGEAFYDSLYVKGIPLHQLIVTSVLRTMDDVARLRRVNGNATEQSCHLYGTTFDICYNRYQPISREVPNDTLKYVLSEVLRDKRREGRCHIKYELKQGCFHMTVR